MEAALPMPMPMPAAGPPPFAGPAMGGPHGGARRPGASLYGIDLGIPLQGRRVLIADPSPFSRKTLTRFLAWVGISDIVFAADGREVLERAPGLAADLILLDADLGSHSGAETCRLLRAMPAVRDVPILLQITSQSDQARARCFQAGASDVVPKPVNPGELIARLRYHLERRAMIRDLTEFRRRIERDLEVAHAMQLALIPRPELIAAVAGKRGLAITAHFESCDEIGGDFWSLYDIDEDRIGVLVVDFSGHGIAAAINAFRFETLVSRCSRAERADPGGLLTRLNRELCEILSVGQYCTAFYGVFDTLRRTLTYACASQPNPLIAGGGGDIRTVDGSGVFLGCWRDEHYETKRLELEPKGFLFLYSDALTESPDRHGAELGEEGLLSLAREMAPRERPLDGLLERFAAARDRPYRDDLTAVWIAWP